LLLGQGCAIITESEWQQRISGIEDGEQDQGPYCPDTLPDIPSDAIVIDQDGFLTLQETLTSAAEGSTFIFESGTYNLGSSEIRIYVDGLTLRSQSGRAEDVVIAGGYADSAIRVDAANLTIADVTLQPNGTAIWAYSAQRAVTGLLVHNVVIVDPLGIAIRATAHVEVDPDDGEITDYYPDNGTVRCSEVRVTTPLACPPACIHGKSVDGWSVHHNRLTGSNCVYPSMGIRFGGGSRDTQIFANEIREFGTGIMLGWVGGSRTYDNRCPDVEEALHYGGSVHNNFVFGAEMGTDFDAGISLWDVCDAPEVLHNTVVSITDPNAASIEWLGEDNKPVLANNLASWRINDRESQGATLDIGNLSHIGDQLDELFVDAEGGDLHLKAGATAIDHSDAEIDLVTDDIDGDPRDDQPDVGADEFVE
jgi:hypothetical protein